MRRWKLGAGLLMMILVVVGSAGTAAAAPGDLDASFGSGGIVSSSAGSGADVALQPDGKIVVVGKHELCPHGSTEPCESEFLVERYEADGSLDNSFGAGGIVLTSFGGTEAAASSVIVESSGKILVGGVAGGEFALARYNSDGSLDTSFGGGDGESTASIPAADASDVRSEAGGIALLSSGGIVIGGSLLINEQPAGEPDWQSHMVLARFNSDGSLDTSFGTNGSLVGPKGHLFGLTVDGSDRIVAAGTSPDRDFVVARFNSGGSLDGSFAGTGTVKLSPSEVFGSAADDVLLQPDGKILASGYVAGIMTVYRLNEDGSLDTTFGGGDGMVTPSFGLACCNSSSAVALAQEADGRIVVVGNRMLENFEEENPFKFEWTVARLHSNGVPDKTFGTNGLVTEGFEGNRNYEEAATGVALQTDGKVVAVGTSGLPNNDLGVMRFLGGGSEVEPSYHQLSVTKAGPGNGLVRGIDLFCGFDCAADYEAGETVELIAEGEYVQEGGEWRQQPFAGWTTISGNPGTCTGTTTPCKVTLSGDVALQAQFGGSAVPEEPGGGGEVPEGGGSGGSETPPGGGGNPGGGVPGGGGSGTSPGTGSTTPSPAPAPSGPAGTTPSVSPEAGREDLAVLHGAAFVRKGRAILRLHCPPGGPACAGTVKLVVALHQVKHSRHAKRPGGTAGRTLRRTKRIVIGKSHFRVAPGRAGSVHVKLTSRGKTLVAKAGKRGLKVQAMGGGHRSRKVMLKVIASPRAR